jgi:hypothetical protein
MVMTGFDLGLFFLIPIVGINVYAPAIRDALKRGDLREMKVLLKYSKKLLIQQGNLPKAVQNLDAAIHKLERKPRK